jgi:signal transduction histidine kinase
MVQTGRGAPVGGAAVQQVLEEGLDRWNGPQGMALSGVLRDITERKRAEAELAAANRELERANRPEGNRCLRRMADSTVYMQQLIHDLIDLSRVGRSGVEPIEVDLGRLVRAIAEDAGAANPAAEIRVGRLPVVTGDPVGFRQLFTNLLENALRHGGRPDLVVVDGRDRPDAAVELSVRGNGKGIPAEHRERVFGVFERLEAPSTSDGTGMGLAIWRKIVEVLGGPAPSSATAAPTSASCSPRPWGPTGRPTS